MSIILRASLRGRLMLLVAAFFAAPFCTIAATYYLDPVNGSNSNNGSSSQPWGSLESVLDEKTINAGDTLYLRNGRHGSPLVQGHKSSNVLITAQSGHQPTLRKITFRNASNWIIDGLEISPRTLSVPIYSNEKIVFIESTSHHITVRNCKIYFAESVSGWNTSNADRLGTAVQVNGANCEITGNDISICWRGIYNDSNAASMTATYNSIVGIGLDGIYLRSSGAVVEDNYIADFYGINTEHDDGIQAEATGDITGLKIRRNLIINHTAPGYPFPDLYGVQGIALLDGNFINCEISNNTVVTDRHLAISLLGGNNCQILNNTVVKSAVPGYSYTPMIQVANSKSGASPVNVVVQNNLSPKYEFASSGVTNTQNQLYKEGLADAYFEDWNGEDYRLRRTAPAIVGGSTTGGSGWSVPSDDLYGYPRWDAISLGAQEFVSFADDFNDGNYTGWSVSGGSWSVYQSNHLRHTGSTGIATAGDANWDNYFVQASMILDSSPYANLVARYQNSTNFYQLELKPGEIAIWRCLNGSYTKLTSKSISSITTGQWYTVGFQVDGTQLRAYLNGSLELTTTNTSFSAGKVGVRGNGTIRWDDFTVQPLWDSLYQNSFTSISGWTPSGSGWSKTSADEYKYSGSSARYSTAGNSAWTNYIVSSAIRLENSNYASVIGRFQNGSNFYQLEISSSGISLWKQVNGSWTNLGSASISLNSSDWYHVALEMDGNQLKGYLNGDLEITATDSAFSSGKIGLRARGTSTLFDDVGVTGL
jgi:parallel beta-helix repeat protein